MRERVKYIQFLYLSHLEVPVDHPVHLEVIVVLAEGVDQRLRYLQPTHVEEELQREVAQRGAILGNDLWKFANSVTPRYKGILRGIHKNWTISFVLKYRTKHFPPLRSDPKEAFDSSDKQLDVLNHVA